MEEIKSERKEPLGRRRCRWEDDIKIDLEGTVSSTSSHVDWNQLAQDRVLWEAAVNTVMNFLVP
jgi:hypothetical protein